MIALAISTPAIVLLGQCHLPTKDARRQSIDRCCRKSHKATFWLPFFRSLQWGDLPERRQAFVANESNTRNDENRAALFEPARFANYAWPHRRNADERASPVRTT
jgi:hypothetical protein